MSGIKKVCLVTAAVLLLGLFNSAVVAAQDGYWLDNEVKQFEDNLQTKMQRLDAVKKLVAEGMDQYEYEKTALGSPVSVEEWQKMLVTTLNIKDMKIVQTYTSDLTGDKYIRRDIAVAGMMKLLHFTGMVTARDATDQEIQNLSAAFNDCTDVFDKSKLARAYSEGLVKGYGSCDFCPQKMLAKAEALAMMVRIIQKYV